MIPKEWRFCRVGANKAPFESKWNEKPLLLEDAQDAPAVGVLCGPVSGGLLMVDHDGESCEELIKQLSDGAGLPYTVKVTSGKKGRFQCAYLIPQKYWNNVGNRTIATGVYDQDGKPEQLDFRWEGRQSVVMGVHPDTGSYQWVNSPDDVLLAQAPQWIIELMSHQSGDELARVVDMSRAKELLWLIRPSEDYHEWITVGMALKSVDEGLLDDWIEWSMQARNACEHISDYQAKWDSFKREDGVTLGTLHYLAYGATDGHEPDPLAASLERRKAILQWVFVASEERYYLKANPLLSLKTMGFDKFIGPIAVETEKGIKYEAASKHLPRKSNLLALTWKPGKERIINDDGFNMLNLHQPYRMGNQGDPSMMIKHVHYLYPNEASVIFDFMAYTLQHPYRKINYSLYMVGKEGTGKNTIFEPMRWAMGYEFHCLDADDLGGNYNGVIGSRKLLIIDEPRNSNDSRWHMAESLKTLIATSDDEATILIKPKYGKERLQDNLANVIILTNHSDAIRITGGRRFFACYDDKLPREPEYYTQLFDWMKNGGNEAFVYWLYERDVSGFNPKSLPTATNSREAIELDSRSSLADAIEDVIDEIGVTSYSVCMDIARGIYGHNMSDASLKRVIAEINCVVAPRMVNGKRVKYRTKIDGQMVNMTPVYKKSLSRQKAADLLKDYYRHHHQFPNASGGMFEEEI